MIYMDVTLNLIQQLQGTEAVLALINSGKLKEVNGIKYLITPSREEIYKRILER